MTSQLLAWMIKRTVLVILGHSNFVYTMTSLMPPVPKPKSRLARYRVLSPHASVHVSPLQLGGMSIGDKWENLMGSMDKESSFQLLDAFYEAGGNFIDTANN